MMKNTDTLAVIQARMGSRRLPGKMMLPLAGQPVLRLVIERVKRARKIGSIVLATSVNKNDDCLAGVARSCGVDTCRGSELDLVSRFNDCIKLYAKPGIIIRICADNPLVCPELVDSLIESHIRTDADYSCVCPERGWPDGVGCEVADRALLMKLSALPLSETEKEHCFGYIWNNLSEFRVNFPESGMPGGLPGRIRIDLNTDEDYKKLCLFSEGLSFSELVSLSLEEIIKKYKALHLGD